MTENNTFHQTIKEIETNSRVYLMHNYIQHGSITTYDHCLSVASMSYWLNRKFHLHSDEKQLIRGAFLHDYFLYDWHHYEGNLHGFSHPHTALINAREDFMLTRKEENIIRSHMWPLTFWHYPQSREAVIVCLADKIVSTKETLFKRKKIA
ncbi:HD domain-containing protein [Sharpea azabuensis]|uniref:HD domain-containing protein n=1 Tax=Sharpea azabuensis TaxID=322505 RepID=A0A1H6VZB4_9FIRM|nr:HD domain-containing protein [Sharpea azabuensis]MEE3307537.1 HD domain-containing protein [Sharpea azabuensis]SEJ10021.1 uncharacterized protein SAMN04487834_10567 [Sharpea azabuensis]SFD77824.1 uncharacterized protein SAMN04487836_10839 [Sharpea azabuensis]SFK71394.1 uncharacterized protein SAMN04487835_10746 [Sharpea azabuensis]